MCAPFLFFWIRLRELLKIHPHCVEGSGLDLEGSAAGRPRKARGAEFVRGAHRETEMRKKLELTEPANSSVRPWKGGVPIYI